MSELRGRCLGCRAPGPGYCGGCGSYIDDEWDGKMTKDSEYERGWNDGYKAAISVLRNIGAPAVIDALEGAFIGSSGNVMAGLLEKYEYEAHELMRGQ
jgi:hypothetical protein